MYIIVGIKKHQKLFSNKGLHTRPTSGKIREAVFDICQLQTENADFLDLFAGFGAMGLEALSRGARWCTFVDHNRNCTKLIKKNLENLQFQDQADIFCQDVIKALTLLEKKGKSYDIIYCDAPYEEEVMIQGKKAYLSQLVLNAIDTSLLLKPGGSLFLEEAKGFSLEKQEWNSLEEKRVRNYGRSQLFHFKHCK